MYFCCLEAIEAVLDTSEGDMRKAITYLQSAARLKTDETVTKADIYEIAGVGQILYVCVQPQAAT